MWGCVERWRDCVDKLSTHDIAGVEWYPEVIPTRTGGKDGDCHGFFAGNFFWSTGQFLNTLPSISALDKSNRWNAEAWIGLGSRKPRVYEVKNMRCQQRQGMFFKGFNRDHYTKDIIFVDATRYKHTRKKQVRGMIEAKVKCDSTVMVMGIGQKYLGDYLSVKQEPMYYIRKIVL